MHEINLKLVLAQPFTHWVTIFRFVHIEFFVFFVFFVD